MAKALGIGGIFFKSADPKALAAWYESWLGLSIEESFGGCIFAPTDLPDAAYTLWTPFKADTDYFNPSKSAFMINLIVDDVQGAMAQVVEGGGTLVGEPEDSEFGMFAWFLDPDENKVELWQPK